MRQTPAAEEQRLFTHAPLHSPSLVQGLTEHVWLVSHVKSGGQSDGCEHAFASHFPDVAEQVSAADPHESPLQRA